MDVDTESFIIEIHNRPCIWDSSLPEYANREMKKRSWEEIVDLCGGHGRALDEKRYLGIVLQKRWKGIRSSYQRELKRQRSGAANRKSEYTYFKQLQFLHKVMTVRDLQDGEEDEHYDAELVEKNCKRRLNDETLVSDGVARDRSGDHSHRHKLARPADAGPSWAATHGCTRCSTSRHDQEDEFDVFGRNVSLQLKKMPEIYALESQELIQRILKEHRIKAMRMETPDPPQSHAPHEPSSSMTQLLSDPETLQKPDNDPLQVKVEVSDDVEMTHNTSL